MGSKTRPGSRSDGVSRNSRRTGPGTGASDSTIAPASVPRPASRAANPGGRRRRAHPPDPAQQLAKRRVSRQVGAQHQRIDEEADQALELNRFRPAMGLPTAMSSWPEYRARSVLNAASRVMNSVTFSRRPRASARRSSLPEEIRYDRASVGRQRRPRPVGGQGHGVRSSFEIPLPKRDLRLETSPCNCCRCQSAKSANWIGSGASDGASSAEEAHRVRQVRRHRIPIDQPSATIWCIMSSRTCSSAPRRTTTPRSIRSRDRSNGRRTSSSRMSGVRSRARHQGNSRDRPPGTAPDGACRPPGSAFRRQGRRWYGGSRGG